MIPVAKRDGKTEEVAKIREAALEDKVSKYSLNPVSMGVFGASLTSTRWGF